MYGKIVMFSATKKVCAKFDIKTMINNPRLKELIWFACY